MLLVRKLCMDLKKPVFEVLSWPVSELEYWQLYSITEKDKPILPVKTAENTTVAESKAAFREIFGD